MVDFLRDQRGAVIGFKPKIEDLILDPPPAIAQVECDWVTQTGPVMCGPDGRAVMHLHALGDTVLQLVHYHWIDFPPGQFVMTTYTQRGFQHKRRIEVKTIWGKSSAVEAVQNAPVDADAVMFGERIDMQVFQHPKDFRVWRGNVRLKKGECIGVACAATPKARCKVTVAGSEDGTKFTEDPGWWMVK